MDIYEIRRRNFARLVREDWGGHRAVAADALGFKEVNLVTRYMAQGASAKNIGAAMARKMEKAAKRESGWMDVAHSADGENGPPNKAIRRGSLEERINALPEALRDYILLELQLCETVQGMMPAEFTRPPTWKTRRAFQDYLHRLIERAA